MSLSRAARPDASDPPPTTFPTTMFLPAWLSSALLLLLTTIAAGTDLVTHKIHNATTYSGIVLALTINGLAYDWDEPRGLPGSVKGLLACGGVMLLAFVFFQVGGGDVKLLTMMGAFLGVEQGMEALLWTFVLGGVFGVALLIWRVGFLKLAAGSIRHLLWSLKLGSWLPLSEAERQSLQPPLYLAPAAVAGVLIVVFDLVHLV
ncbi:MAG: prepilin peptidase [Planctomycetales bacterium]